MPLDNPTAVNRVSRCIQTLAILIASLHWTQASAACPVHNHLCTFHALGAKVDVTLSPGVTFNPANSLVIYAIGKDPVTGAASTVDFDNEAKLPTYTGDKFLAGSPANYNISAGPYIVNTTTYGASHPPGTWSVPGDSGLQVTPSQYKNTFNANTAVARHTGDFNGGENGNIPGATGCPNMPGASNCEAVVVTGNVPNGVYEQKVRLFNFYGVPDPKVDLQVGAYVTGQLVIVANSHDVNQVASFPKLEGTGSTTPTYQYEVYNRQFDPHAAGVATFDRMNWGKVRTGGQFVQNGHRFLTQVQDSTTTRTKVYGDTGWATQNTWVNKPKTVGYVYVGEEPKPVVSVRNSTASTQIGVGSLKIRGANELSLTGFSTTQQNVPPIGYCIGVFCPGVTPMKLADVANANLTPINEIQIPACTSLGCPLVYKDVSKEKKSGIQTNKFLDGLQTGGDYVSLVGVTGAGEVVSTPVDIGNTALSFARATTNTAKTYGYVLSAWIFDDPTEYKKAEELNNIALSQYKDASLSALGVLPFLNSGILKQGSKRSDEIIDLIDGAHGGNAATEGLAFRTDLPSHMVGPDGFTKLGQLSGTHNLTNATSLLDTVGSAYTLKPTGTVGVYELSYTYTNPATGKMVSGSKTVYDPAVFSDQTMVNNAQQAGQQAWMQYLQNPTVKVIDGSAGGVNFRSYINFDKKGNPFIGNVHPIK